MLQVCHGAGSTRKYAYGRGSRGYRQITPGTRYNLTRARSRIAHTSHITRRRAARVSASERCDCRDRAHLLSAAPHTGTPVPRSWRAQRSGRSISFQKEIRHHGRAVDACISVITSRCVTLGAGGEWPVSSTSYHTGHGHRGRHGVGVLGLRIGVSGLSEAQGTGGAGARAGTASTARQRSTDGVQSGAAHYRVGRNPYLFWRTIFPAYRANQRPAPGDTGHVSAACQRWNVQPGFCQRPRPPCPRCPRLPRLGPADRAAGT